MRVGISMDLFTHHSSNHIAARVHQPSEGVLSPQRQPSVAPARTHVPLLQSLQVTPFIFPPQSCLLVPRAHVHWSYHLHLPLVCPGQLNLGVDTLFQIGPSLVPSTLQLQLDGEGLAILVPQLRVYIQPSHFMRSENCYKPNCRQQGENKDIQLTISRPSRCEIVASQDPRPCQQSYQSAGAYPILHRWISCQPQASHRRWA
mmetsp:Transcript_53094/g.98208  ORF Transcript_53094/g.98208 Transcript_53094/m.98208 type:complete len:202 (-) Transcript_53094:236-841(-)